LFFRLSSLQLTVPALRERVEDISVLAQHFIAMLQSDIKFELSPAGVAALRDYNWPGNVRQLQNVVGSTDDGIAKQACSMAMLSKRF